MDKYTIVALPEESSLQKLNSIRTYLYTNGFRHSNNPPANDVHITLAQVNNFESSEAESIKEEVQKVLERFAAFDVSYGFVTDKVHEATEKHPLGSAWIALYFEDPQLKKLAREIDLVLLQKGISGTKEYVSELGLGSNHDLYSKIADHMNLCNYGRVETASEARKYIETEAPKTFLIDRVALRDSQGKYVWELSLHKN